MYERNVPINLELPGNKDQSKNPISSSRIIYFLGGSACEYAVNVKN